MIEHVRALAARTNAGRRVYIQETLRAWGAPFVTQTFNRIGRTGQNILIDYPFTKAPRSNQRYVLLSAHYDAWFRSPGANDNASGVAVLLDLLRRVCSEGPPTRLRFVFFDGEEGIGPWFATGSRHYMRGERAEDIEAAYNLEMVGRGDTLLLWPARPETAEKGWLAPLMTHARQGGLALEAYPELRVKLISFLGMPLGFASDHIPLIQAGVDHACSLTVLPTEDLRFRYILEGKHLAQFRRALVSYFLFHRGDVPELLKHYHTKDDSADYIDPGTLRKVSEALWKTVCQSVPAKHTPNLLDVSSRA